MINLENITSKQLMGHQKEITQLKKKAESPNKPQKKVRDFLRYEYMDRDGIF